jgi:hypothetical protein
VSSPVGRQTRTGDRPGEGILENSLRGLALERDAARPRGSAGLFWGPRPISGPAEAAARAVAPSTGPGEACWVPVEGGPGRSVVGPSAQARRAALSWTCLFPLLEQLVKRYPVRRCRSRNATCRRWHRPDLRSRPSSSRHQRSGRPGGDAGAGRSHTGPAVDGGTRRLAHADSIILRGRAAGGTCPNRVQDFRR